MMTIFPNYIESMHLADKFIIIFSKLTKQVSEKDGLAANRSKKIRNVSLDLRNSEHLATLVVFIPNYSFSLTFLHKEVRS